MATESYPAGVMNAAGIKSGHWRGFFRSRTGDSSGGERFHSSQPSPNCHQFGYMELNTK